VLVANISVGNPAKNFSVMFDLWSSDLSLMDWNVSYSKKLCWSDCYSENRTLHRRNLYNTSASTTYTPGATYRFDGPVYGDDKGIYVNDLVNIGGLLKYMKFGDLTQVGLGFYNYPIDGILGLSMRNSTNYIPTVLAQMVSSLAEPVVTLHVNRTKADDNRGRRYTDAEIMFGSKALPQCNQANWKTISLLKPSRYRATTFSPANATSISIASPVAGGCDNAVEAVHPLVFSDNMQKMLVSVQALKVFQKAVGAEYNSSWYAYTVDCAKVDTAMNVNIALADGNTIVMEPWDYIYKKKSYSYGTMCILDVEGAYDDGDKSNKVISMQLGQTWLNRHCISYDINNNTMSYTDALPNNGN